MTKRGAWAADEVCWGRGMRAARSAMRPEECVCEHELALARARGVCVWWWGCRLLDEILISGHA